VTVSPALGEVLEEVRFVVDGAGATANAYGALVDPEKAVGSAGA
jgi:hypothetical protein